jgi:hypothetical protein
MRKARIQEQPQDVVNRFEKARPNPSLLFAQFRIRLRRALILSPAFLDSSSKIPMRKARILEQPQDVVNRFEKSRLRPPVSFAQFRIRLRRALILSPAFLDSSSKIRIRNAGIQEQPQARVNRFQKAPLHATDVLRSVRAPSSDGIHLHSCLPGFLIQNPNEERRNTGTASSPR